MKGKFSAINLSYLSVVMASLALGIGLGQLWPNLYWLFWTVVAVEVVVGRWAYSRIANGEGLAAGTLANLLSALSMILCLAGAGILIGQQWPHSNWIVFPLMVAAGGCAS